MDNKKLQSIVESLLFVNAEPISKKNLSKILDVDEEKIESAVEDLKKEYASAKRGIAIFEKDGFVQLVSLPENGQYVERLVKGELQDSLSQAALEVLSIIAYRSPISKVEIEMIRGVNCNYTLRNLLMRGLIEKNNNPKDNRGYVYSITFDFLKKLGIDRVEKLPQYGTLSKDSRINSIIEEELPE